MQDALEQHIGLIIEVINGTFADVADVNEASVVDEAVDRPELRLRVLDCSRKRRIVGDVGRGEAMRTTSES